MRRYGNNISRRIRGKKKIKNIGRISKMVRNTSRVLLWVMKDGKV